MAVAVARLAADKKAAEIIVLGVGEAVSYTDFLVIASGANTRQTRAIASEIQQKLKELKVRPTRVEGEAQGEWILIDYLFAVVHIFTPAARDFYRLETLWGDVPRIELPDLTAEQLSDLATK